MSNFWCVEPETDDVEVSVDGRSFKVWFKRELTVGEQRQVDTAGFRAITGVMSNRRGGGEPEIAIDWKAQMFARVVAYVADWSLVDEKGNKLPLPDTLYQLRSSVFDAIASALDAHVERRETMRKNGQSETGPSAQSA